MRFFATLSAKALSLVKSTKWNFFGASWLLSEDCFNLKKEVFVVKRNNLPSFFYCLIIGWKPYHFNLNWFCIIRFKVWWGFIFHCNTFIKAEGILPMKTAKETFFDTNHSKSIIIIPRVNYWKCIVDQGQSWLLFVLLYIAISFQHSYFILHSLYDNT